MRLHAINNYYDNKKPNFGIKIHKDAEFYTIRAFFNNFSPEGTDNFFKSIKESCIGGNENSINMVFSPMFIKDGMPTIGYSFWRNNEDMPRVTQFYAIINGFWNTLNTILEDCSGFNAHIYDSKIARRNNMPRTGNSSVNIFLVDNSDKYSIF